MKKTITIIIVILILVLGAILLASKDIKRTQQSPIVENQADYKNISYIIDGQKILLTNGTSETEAAPGSASKIITKYFGDDLKIDLNNDGREDNVFVLTQETGGSGTFFYVVAAINTENGYIGSDGYLLGDRIAPQTIEKSQNPTQKGVVVVNYMDRAKEEPMTKKPSEGKSISLKLDENTMQWGIVEPNFEGEANPAQMSLMMKSWTWIKAQYNDGKTIEPKKTDVFTLTFKKDGTFTATTDCNNMGGKYSNVKNSLVFSNIYSTKMYCEDSQENDFASLLDKTNGYLFTSKGELVLDLKLDSGSVYFK